MCSASKLVDPFGLGAAAAKNPLVNPASAVTSSSNRLVNPMGLLTGDTKKAAPAQAAAGSLLTAPTDPTQKKASSLLGG